MSEEHDILKSGLVPKHEVMNDEEKTELLNGLNISAKQLPRIHEDDPVAKKIGAKRGNVVRITRNDPGVGEYYYYRIVV
jgi:DNA-directed RNA polymerase subunit H (RpoH/RPB5)